MPTICTRVPADLAERVEAAAKADDRSVSWFVRRALEEKLGKAPENSTSGTGSVTTRIELESAGVDGSSVTSPASPQASGKRTITPRPKGGK